MTPQTKQILIGSLVLGIFTTIIVMWNTPSIADLRREQRQNQTAQLFKVFILSFGLCALVLYIMQDNDSNAMMTNIIKGEPDF